MAEAKVEDVLQFEDNSNISNVIGDVEITNKEEQPSNYYESIAPDAENTRTIPKFQLEGEPVEGVDIEVAKTQPIKYAKLQEYQAIANEKPKFRVMDALDAGYSYEEIAQFMLKDPELNKEITPYLEKYDTSNDAVFNWYADSINRRASAARALKLLKENKSVIESDLKQGWNKTITGVAITALDIGSLLGIDYSPQTQFAYEQLQDFGKLLSSTYEDDSFWSQSTLGEMGPSLATLPLALESKAAVFAVEGAVGYATARATNDKETSAIVGLASGAGSVAIGKAVDLALGKVSTKAQEKVYNYYKNQLNFTDEEADAIYNDWLKIMEPSGNEYNDRLKAILDYSGYKGANVKYEAFSDSLKVQKSVDLEQKERKALLKQLASGDNDINQASDVFTNNVIKVNELYNRMQDNFRKSGILNAEVHTYFTRIDGNIPSSIQSTLDRTVYSQIKTVEDLMEASKVISQEIYQAKDAYTKKQLLKLYKEINKSLKQKLAPEDYLFYSSINRHLANINSLKNNRVGKILQDLSKGNITTTKAIKALNGTSNMGNTIFRQLEKSIGTEHTKQIEIAMIHELVRGADDSISIRTLANNVRTKGFISKEANNFASIVDIMEKSFLTDEVIRAANLHKIAIDSGGLSADLKARIATSIVGKIFRQMQKLIPNETGKALRMRDKLVKVLSNPNKVRDMQEAIANMNLTTKSDMLKDAVDKLLSRQQAILDRAKNKQEPSIYEEPIDSLSEIFDKDPDDVVGVVIKQDSDDLAEIINQQLEDFAKTQNADKAKYGSTIYKPKPIKGKIVNNPNYVKVVTNNGTKVLTNEKEIDSLIKRAITLNKVNSTPKKYELSYDALHKKLQTVDVDSRILSDFVDYIVNGKNKVSKLLNELYKYQSKLSQGQIRGRGTKYGIKGEIIAYENFANKFIKDTYGYLPEVEREQLRTSLVDILRDVIKHVRRPYVLEHGTNASFKLQDIQPKNGEIYFKIGKGSVDKIKSNLSTKESSKLAKIKRGIFNLRLYPIFSANSNNVKMAKYEILRRFGINANASDIDKLVEEVLSKNGYDGILFSSKGYKFGTSVIITKPNVKTLILRTLDEGEK